MDLEEAISMDAVFMPRSSLFLMCQGKSSGLKSPRNETSSLEEGGKSGDRGFKASGRRKSAVAPPQKLSHNTALFLVNSKFPAALLSMNLRSGYLLLISR
jgi:hypothetical protein